ncbi:MAG: caspase family protein [Thiomargarita sp.]|nr:caspase family protein [Thiomargarita sp.]
MQIFKLSFLIVGLIVISNCSNLRPSIEKDTAESVNLVAFSPNGQVFASASHDNILRLWDINTGKELYKFQHSNRIYNVLFSPDGQSILSYDGADYSEFKLWNVNTGKKIRSLSVSYCSTLDSMVFSPNGQLILFVCNEFSKTYGSYKKFILWDINTRKEIRTFTGHYSDSIGTNNITSVKFSPDGQLALSSSWDKTVKLWNINTGKEIHSFEHSNWVNYATFSADGQIVLSTSRDGIFRRWDIKTGREISNFLGKNFRYADENEVAFSYDRELFVVANTFKTLELWNIDSGKNIRTFKGHSGHVDSVAFSRNKQMILSGSRDGSSRIWNVKTGKEIVQMISFKDGGWASITPDGYYVASANAKQHLKNPSSLTKSPEKVRLALAPFTNQMLASSSPIIRPRTDKIVEPVFFKDTTSPQIIINKSDIIQDKYILSGQVIDESGIASIKINGNRTRFDERGYFSTELQLQVGNNRIRITATDKHNNATNKKFVIARAKPPKQQSILPKQRYALLIGNQNYPSYPLHNPHNDVDDMETALKSIGFTVYVFKDMKLREMKLKISGFGDSLERSQGMGLFYFSGHGVQNEGKNYLLPIGAMDTVNVKAHLATEALDMNYLLASLGAADNPLNLVFLDACRNNPFYKGWSKSGMSEIQGLTSIKAPSGSLIAYATQADRTAINATKQRNSYYTQYLKQEIVKPGVSIFEMLTKVRAAVKKATYDRQEPDFTSKLNNIFCLKEPCN